MKAGDKCIVTRQEPWVMEAKIATVDRHTVFYVFTEKEVFYRCRHPSGDVTPYSDEAWTAFQRLIADFAAEQSRHREAVIEMTSRRVAIIGGLLGGEEA
jgi:hypothetical protein